MADQKITELTEDTSPSSDDLIVTVNDPLGTPGSRKVTLANLAAALSWIADTNTWTYSSVDGATGIVTINADLTGRIHAGDRIKLTQTTDKYFIVTKDPTFATGNTTLTFWGGTDYTLANAAIASPFYSHQKNPFGFNSSPLKWLVEVTDTNLVQKASPGNGTWYNQGTISITVPIGLWSISYQAILGCNRATSTATGTFITLSNANNSESDTDLTWYAEVDGASGQVGLHVPLYRQKFLSLASKTVYYLNIMTTGVADNIFIRGDSGKTIIRAVCAYL